MLDREDAEYLSTYISECLSDMEARVVLNSYDVDVYIPMEDFRLWLTISQWGYQGERAVRLGFRSSTDAPLKQSLKVKCSEGGNWLLDQRKLRAKVQEAIADAQNAHDDEIARKQEKIDFKESVEEFAALGRVSLGLLPEFSVQTLAGNIGFRKEEDGTYTLVSTSMWNLQGITIQLADGRIAALVEAGDALMEADKEVPETT